MLGFSVFFFLFTFQRNHIRHFTEMKIPAIPNPKTFKILRKPVFFISK